MIAAFTPAANDTLHILQRHFLSSDTVTAMKLLSNKETTISLTVLKRYAKAQTVVFKNLANLLDFTAVYG